MTDDPWDAENPASLTRTAELKKDGSGLSAAFLRLVREALRGEKELDGFRLGEGDVVICRGEVEQDVREHPDEDAGVLPAVLHILLGEVPEEDRGQEIRRLADGAGKSPEHVGGRLVPP